MTAPTSPTVAPLPRTALLLGAGFLVALRLTRLPPLPLS